VLFFLWAKGLDANDIKKKMFPAYGVKCLSRKAIHAWIDKFSQGYSKVADDARPGEEVAETIIKKRLCCGFLPTAKAMRPRSTLCISQKIW
jgi:hypothetical protein